MLVNIRLNYCLDKWCKYQQVTILRSVSNNSDGLKKNPLKQLLKKSLKFASMALGVSLLTFGGYSLGWILFFKYFFFFVLH